MQESELNTRQKVTRIGVATALGGLSILVGEEVFSSLTHDVLPVVNDSLTVLGRTALFSGLGTAAIARYYRAYESRREQQ